MTRRLILAMVGLAGAALLLAGLGTVLIGQWRARNATLLEVRRQTVELATLYEQGLARAARSTTRANRVPALATLARLVDLDELQVVRVRADGRPDDDADLPERIRDVVAAIDPAALRGEGVRSGVGRREAWAIAPVLGPAGRVRALVVGLRPVTNGVGAMFGWLIAAATLVMAGAAAIAVWLGRRLTAPVRAASTAAGEIAAGRHPHRSP
ncbi:MAG: hypothetical protein R2698_09075 [Microthrixaceae bacterium]